MLSSSRKYFSFIFYLLTAAKMTLSLRGNLNRLQEEPVQAMLGMWSLGHLNFKNVYESYI